MPCHVILFLMPFFLADIWNLRMSYYAENRFYLPGVPSSFCILVLLFVNSLQALCEKSNSGMKLSRAHKKLLILLFIFTPLNKISHNNEILLKGVLISGNNLDASYSFINLAFFIADNRFWKSVRLLPLNIKSIYPMQKYPHIIES